MLRELTVLVLALGLCCELTWSAPTELTALKRLESMIQAKLDTIEKVTEQGSVRQFVNKLKRTNISPSSLAEVVHYLSNPSAGPILNHPLDVGALRKMLAVKSIISSRQKSFKK